MALSYVFSIYIRFSLSTCFYGNIIIIIYNKIFLDELVKEEQENDPNISTAVAQERISETDSTNIWWLSCTLYHECRSLNDEAQIAVASVIMNRVKSDKFPNTIFEVLIQPGQYASLMMK